MPTLLAIAGGWTDWRSRRIPNWLTVPGLLLGIAVNSWLHGWLGAKASLLGAGLGLALLLPFVLIRSLGAGDWKFVGALGAFLGPENLLTVLLLGILVNGLMASDNDCPKKAPARNPAQSGTHAGRFPFHALARPRPDAG